jgi:peptidoglycan/LPS O-acetylase OafA/YrhL
VKHGRISNLDGLRGLAVLLVVGYHYRGFHGPGTVGVDAWLWGLLDGGWMGVDLFFVLSGFLITGILADSRGTARYFRNFYLRRLLRITPLYFVVLAFLMLLPHVADALHLSLSAVRPVEWWMYWTYLANVEQFLNGTAIGAPLGVMWSLAIEEQFYLVWPLAVLLLSRRSMLMLCGAILVAEPLVRLWLMQTTPIGAVYIFTPSHLDGLAMGAAIALAVREPRVWVVVRRCARPAALVGMVVVAGIGLSVALGPYSFVMEEVGLSAIALMLGGMLVLALTAPPSAVLSRALNLRGLESVGRYSYAIYLFHQIVGQIIGQVLQRLALPAVFGSFIPATLVMMLAAVSISFGLAWVSWHAFEGPIVALKRYFASNSDGALTPLLKTVAIHAAP